MRMHDRLSARDTVGDEVQQFCAVRDTSLWQRAEGRGQRQRGSRQVAGGEARRRDGGPGQASSWAENCTPCEGTYACRRPLLQ